MDLADSEVLVLADAPAPGGAVAARIRAHVERGGGLLLTGGDAASTRALRSRLRGLLPARLSGPVSGGVDGPRPVADDAAGGLRAATTRRRWMLESPAAGAEEVLRFGDGSPALLRWRVGAGRVAVLATSVDDSWSDLPYQPGYLPLMVQLIRWLAPTRTMRDAPLAPGTVARFRPPPGTVQLTVETPNGETLRFDGDALDDVRVEDTEQPGAYRVRIATTEQALAEAPRLAFVVAPPAEESNLDAGPVPEDRGSGGETSRQSVVNRPLAPWLFLAVGVLALLEAAMRLRLPVRRA